MARRRGFVVLGFAVVAGLGLWLLATSAGPPRQERVFGTGPVGGSWYPLDTAAGEIWRRELGVRVHVELGGAEANLRGVQTGVYDLGVSHSFAAYNASLGLGPFAGD